MIAIVTPEPSRPSSFCARSAPVRPTAFLSSMLLLPTFSEGGSDIVSTGKNASKPGIYPSAPTCEGATETEYPFQRLSKEKRSVTLTPSAAAFALNAACSAFKAGALVPLEDGGLASSTNQLVGLSFAAPPIGMEPGSAPALPGASARPR